MNIEKIIDNDKVTFLPEGKVDTLTAPELLLAIDEVAADTKQLVLDFAGVQYISSAGLRTLLNAHKKMLATGGEMEVIHVNDTVMAVFSMTGFDKLLTIK